MYIYKNNSKNIKINFEDIISSFYLKENFTELKKYPTLCETILGEKIRPAKFFNSLKEVEEILKYSYFNNTNFSEGENSFYKVDIQTVKYISKTLKHKKGKIIEILITIFLLINVEKFNSKINTHSTKEIFLNQEILELIQNINKNISKENAFFYYIFPIIENFGKFLTSKKIKFTIDYRNKKLILKKDIVKKNKK